MLYYYMDNFRGFKSTVVPTLRTNFLVGENSTGKSSFLRLLPIFGAPEFSLHPQDAFRNTVKRGGFNDLVSAFSKNRRHFDIGIAKFDGQESPGPLVYIYRFHSDDGVPVLSRFRRFRAGQVLEVDLTKKIARYGVAPFADPSSSKEFPAFIRKVAGMKAIGGKIDAPDKLQSAMPLAFINYQISRDHPEIVDDGIANDPIFSGLRFRAFAPIRTAPRAFYDAGGMDYSPEGEHVPLVLRKKLKAGPASEAFVRKLSEFGEASGLFEAIETHPFGPEENAPFEIAVNFHGTSVNLSNVGYGVSQALPLVVEFLNRQASTTFAVQQPEVHLHPRAQAALGGMIHALASQKNHSFFIETHSDYLIDRYRIEARAKKGDSADDAQVLFFSRSKDGNQFSSIPIRKDGTYSPDQPSAFRDFFIEEQIALLDV